MCSATSKVSSHYTFRGKSAFARTWFWTTKSPFSSLKVGKILKFYQVIRLAILGSIIYFDDIEIIDLEIAFYTKFE